MYNIKSVKGKKIFTFCYIKRQNPHKATDSFKESDRILPGDLLFHENLRFSCTLLMIFCSLIGFWEESFLRTWYRWDVLSHPRLPSSVAPRYNCRRETPHRDFPYWYQYCKTITSHHIARAISRAFYIRWGHRYWYSPEPKKISSAATAHTHTHTHTEPIQHFILWYTYGSSGRTKPLISPEPI